MVKLVSILLLILAVASPAQALEHWFSYSGGYGTLEGDDFEGLEAGPTMGVRYSARIWRNLFAGIGGDLSAYGVEETDDKLWQTDASASLRWYFPVGNWSLFVDGFGGYSQYSIRTSFGKFTARGWMYGGAAGLAIPVKGAFIDLVAETNQQGYGDAEVGGGAFEDSDVSGYRALLRASLRIPLGN